MSERDWENIDYIVDKIPVDEISTGRFQSRTLNVEEGLEELAESIRIIGLINPVTLTKTTEGDKKYELIAGQRRLGAVKDILGWTKIPARVLPFIPTEAEAKALSFSENIMRNPLVSRDREASIRLLYLRCNASGMEISRTTGIPYRIVLDVIKYEELPQSLKDEVDAGEVDVDLAKRAVKAAISDGKVDEERAKNVAAIMKTLLPEQQKSLIKITEERPGVSIEELATEARKIPRTKAFRVTLAMDEYTSLSTYAKTEEIAERVAAARILVQSLKDMGYLT